MAPLTAAAGIVLTFIASAPSNSVNAFSPATTSYKHAVTSTSSWRSSPIMSPLQMSDEATAEAEEDSAAVEEAAEPVLDPEVVELKDSITSLESDLRAKKTQLRSLQDNVDKYSKSGFARQVALVENNKRTRGANVADSKDAARATVLQSFLPVLDELDTAAKMYEGNDFARTFDALRSEFDNSLGALGVTEYGVESGQKMDVGRVVAVEEEYSDEFPKGTVISALKSGLEISGNVVRPAEAVGSLGVAGKGFKSAAVEEEGEAGGETPAE